MIFVKRRVKRPDLRFCAARNGRVEMFNHEGACNEQGF